MERWREVLPRRNAQNNTIRLLIHNCARARLTRHWRLAAQTADATGDVLENIRGEGDIKRRPELASAGLLNHVLGKLGSAGLEDGGSVEEDVAFGGGGQVAPGGEGGLGGCDSGKSVGGRGGGAAMDETAIDGGADVEG